MNCVGFYLVLQTCWSGVASFAILDSLASTTYVGVSLLSTGLTYL